MKITLDYNLCEGNGICAQLVPGSFRLDDNGDLQVLDDSPPESVRDRVVAAVRSCPRGAISID